MTEKQIEKYLHERVVLLGGLCYKFVSPGHAGVPDRIVITPDGKTVYAELKTEKGILRPQQRYEHSRMLERGADVRVLRGISEVKNFLREVLHDEI